MKTVQSRIAVAADQPFPTGKLDRALSLADLMQLSANLGENTEPFNLAEEKDYLCDLVVKSNESSYVASLYLYLITDKAKSWWGADSETGFEYATYVVIYSYDDDCFKAEATGNSRAMTPAEIERSFPGASGEARAPK